jgi:hypothetical protein
VVHYPEATNVLTTGDEVGDQYRYSLQLHDRGLRKL